MQVTIDSPVKNSLPFWILSFDQKKDFQDDVMNMVIEAYVQGKQAGYQSRKANEKDVLANQLDSSLKTAMKVFANFHSQATKEFNIDIDLMFLKIEDRYSFTAAVVLPLDFYYSEERRAFTDLQIKTEDENTNSLCNINFMNIPFKPEFNITKLISNGFIFKYDPKET